MRAVGRFLQVLGLILLPASILVELVGGRESGFGVRDMLMMLVFGVAVFYIGRMVEGYARG